MHYDENEYFVASGIRNFKPPLLKVYRNFIQDEKQREKLHLILQNLSAKGYSLPEPKYKRVAKNFDKDDKLSYLTLFGAMYAYKTFSLDEVFFSVTLLDRAFKIYSDMLDLQQWVYEMERSTL
jgi:hypothetical protein